MSDPIPHADGLDLTHIDDPHVRRALRTLQQQMSETLARQQLEIDAIIEVLLEHHLTSLGEFKRQLLRLQQDASRGQRLHNALAATQTPPKA